MCSEPHLGYGSVNHKKKTEQLLFLATSTVESTFQYNVSSTLCISIGLCMTNSSLKMITRKHGQNSMVYNSVDVRTGQLVAIEN